MPGLAGGGWSYIIFFDFFDVDDAHVRTAKYAGTIQDFPASSTNIFERVASSIKGVDGGIDDHRHRIITIIGLGCDRYLHLTYS